MEKTFCQRRCGVYPRRPQAWPLLDVLYWVGPVPYLGKGPATKSDEFLEKFQTAFDPPTFLENYVAIFYNGYMVAFMQGGIGQIVSANIS